MAKIGEIWANSASQKIPGLLSYTLPTVTKFSIFDYFIQIPGLMSYTYPNCNMFLILVY